MSKAATAEMQAQMLSALQALAPATDAVPIVANDNTDLAQEAVGLACGGNAGAVKLKTAAGNDRTIAIATGQTIAIRFRKVYLTGTSATGLTALLNPAVVSTPTPTPMPAPTPQPSLSLSNAVAKAEGNSGTVAFTWTLTLNRDGSTAAYPFAWAVTGSGSNPANAADFGGTLPSGSGTFGIGETTKTITVLVSGDTAVEPDEAFTLAITASGLNTVTSTGTISNDDLPTLSLTPSSASIPANAAAGYQIAAIGNVPNGVTPTLTPNDGRFVIGGSAGTGWVVALGNAAISAGNVNIAVAASGANSATFALTVTAVSSATPPMPTNWDFVGYGDSRTENALGLAVSSSAGWQPKASGAGPFGWIATLSEQRIRYGYKPNFGISASTTTEGAQVPRWAAQSTSATAVSTSRGADKVALHPAGLVLFLYGVNDQDGALPSTSRNNILTMLNNMRSDQVKIVLNETATGIACDGTGTGAVSQNKKDFAAWIKTLSFDSGHANARPDVIVVDTFALTYNPATNGNYVGFLRDDRHFTQWGAKKVAQAIIDRLAQVFGSSWTNLPKRVVLPTSNGATVAADAVGVHAGFVHTNPLMTPGTFGQLLNQNWLTGPTAAQLPQGWAIQAGGTYQDVNVAVDKTGTDPDGYPMTTVTVSGTLPDGGVYNLDLMQIAVASGQFSVNDKIKGVGRIKIEQGSQYLLGVPLAAKCLEQTAAKSQQPVEFDSSAGGTGDRRGYHVNSNGFDAGGDWMTVETQMVDLQNPDVDVANGGAGLFTAQLQVGIWAMLKFANFTGATQTISATVRLARIGMARDGNR